MVEITDQTGVHLALKEPALRIVSLVPSITELLSELELDNEVKGITRFCIHPGHWKYCKTRIGGTKKIKHDMIENLQPDLILANKEENTKEDVEKLREKFPVYTSDVKNLTDAIEMIQHTGLLTGREKQSHELIFSIRNRFERLRKIISGIPEKKALYLLWQNPYMSTGGDTFIHHIMQSAGFKNAFCHFTRYPELTEQQIKESGAEIVLLSSEPFPFNEKHVTKLKNILPGAKVILVDGTFFSWYGSRLAKAPDFFLKLRTRIGIMSSFDPQS